MFLIKPDAVKVSDHPGHLDHARRGVANAMHRANDLSRGQALLDDGHDVMPVMRVRIDRDFENPGNCLTEANTRW
jgi:hypothetical protein